MKEINYANINENIVDCILNDYINGFNLNDSVNIFNRLPLLVDNGLAYHIYSIDDAEFGIVTIYRVACKFIQKYNKSLKDHRRILNSFEFGGKNNIYADYDAKLINLSKYCLETGKYFAQLDDNEYCALEIRYNDSTGDVETDLYIISENWKKYKDKFYKMLDKYRQLNSARKKQRIVYTDGRPSNDVIFKSFDQLVMSDKDKILKYIDNWINNIPLYYEKYKMIAKLSIILYGEPGTGKSTFCKALADYLNIDSVLSISPSYFEFNDASKKDKSTLYNQIISIDDIDCICKSRDITDDKENTEILSNLLSFLDNPPTFDYKAKNGIRYPVSIIVATTNYYDKLDDAVKRYGRFDLKIAMNNFDKKQAQEMCDIYNLKLDDIVDTSGDNFSISPSYLQSLCLENIDKNMKML